MRTSKSKRKARSDKFPLTLHSTGQYCKKIRGKLYYFGADKQKALQRYFEQAADLHSGRSLTSISTSDTVSLRSLCNLYLEHQEKRVQVGDITGHYYVLQIESLRRFAAHIGPNRLVSELRTADIHDYRNKLLKKHSSAASINNHIAVMKAVFHWAIRNDILQNIPNIDTVKKVRIVHAEKPVFSAKDIKKLINAAETQMRAMIWLGLNCAFGCTDCSKLKWKDLDFENSRVKLARNKTGVGRNLPLWPETIEALRPIPRRGELVFYTKRGNPLVRVNRTTDDNGIVRYSRFEAVGKHFSNLLKKTGIKTEPGMGFYTLRRTAATLAANSGDPFAVQRLLGHTDVKMSSIYVQNISKQTDRVINSSRKAIVEDSS